jgi:uncharacterized protein YkwD
MAGGGRGTVWWKGFDEPETGRYLSSPERPTKRAPDRGFRMRVRVAIISLLAPFLAQCAGGGPSFSSLSSLFGGGSPAAPAHRVATKTGDASAAATLVSQYRTANGLPPVVVDATLNRAAEVQARAVAQAGALSHGEFASRMAAFGVNGVSAENLVAGSRTVDQAMARWKASPGHNRNLLMPEARRIGIAYASSPGAGYEHYWAMVLAQ